MKIVDRQKNLGGSTIYPRVGEWEIKLWPRRHEWRNGDGSIWVVEQQEESSPKVFFINGVEIGYPEFSNITGIKL